MKVGGNFNFSLSDLSEKFHLLWRDGFAEIFALAEKITKMCGAF